MLKAIPIFLMLVQFCSCAVSSNKQKDDVLSTDEILTRNCFNYIFENKTKDFIRQISECKNLRNSMGLSPMLMAIAKENIDLVEALIAAGVNVNEVNDAGMTALVFAANKNNIRITQLLRRAGARVEIINNNLSGLMMAARNSSLELIEVMKPTAEEINIPAEDGWTAIYFAINRQQADIVKYLLDHGACTSVKDTEQQTPLQYAEEIGWKEGAKLLKRKNKC